MVGRFDGLKRIDWSTGVQTRRQEIAAVVCEPSHDVRQTNGVYRHKTRDHGSEVRALGRVRNATGFRRRYANFIDQEAQGVAYNVDRIDEITPYNSAITHYRHDPVHPIPTKSFLQRSLS